MSQFSETFFLLILSMLFISPLANFLTNLHLDKKKIKYFFIKKNFIVILLYLTCLFIITTLGYKFYTRSYTNICFKLVYIFIFNILLFKKINHCDLYDYSIKDKFSDCNKVKLYSCVIISLLIPFIALNNTSFYRIENSIPYFLSLYTIVFLQYYTFIIKSININNQMIIKRNLLSFLSPILKKFTFLIKNNPKILRGALFNDLIIVISVISALYIKTIW